MLTPKRTSAAFARALSLLIAGSLAALVAGAPVAAQATPGSLAATDAVYVAECDDAGGTVPPLQVFSVDIATTTLTPAGTGVPSVGDCVYSAAIDPSTGMAYLINGDDDELWAFDPATSSTTKVGAFTLNDGGETSNGVVAFAVDPQGNAFAFSVTQVFSLDLDSALLEPIGENTLSGVNHQAFAVNPVTGVLYVISFSKTDPALYSIDTATGIRTLVTPVDQTDIYAMAFDSRGILWVLSYENPVVVLGSVDIANWADTYVASGALRLADDLDADWFTQAMFVTSSAWPDTGDSGDGDGDGDGGFAEPELAATGSSTIVVAATWGTALLLALGGAALLIARRVRESF